MKTIIGAAVLSVAAINASAQGQVNVICSVQSDWCNSIATIEWRCLIGRWEKEINSLPR